MTRRLILIRHGKSGWDDMFADDHARVLTSRGAQAAQSIGRWLSEQNAIPDHILTSDAARTLETTEQLCLGLNATPTTTPYPQLYHASPDTIHDLCTRQTAQCIAVVGHNPGIGMLAAHLAKTLPKHHRFDDYPTCATTVLDFADDTWMQPAKGTVAAFTTPRDLT